MSMKERFYGLPSLKSACEKEIERVRRLRENDGQNNITFNFHLRYEYGIKYVLDCLGRYVLQDDGERSFYSALGLHVDDFKDFTDDEQKEYESIVDEQYKDTGVNIYELV